MAKYKNREVHIIQEIPHAQGDQVMIEHKELMGQREIVPKNQIVLSKEEKKAKEDEAKKRADANKDQVDPNDYKVEGVNDLPVAPLPTATEVMIQRNAEDNLVRAEEQKAKDEEWNKNHPKAPANAKRQLDAIKVVPYRDETKNEAKRGVVLK